MDERELGKMGMLFGLANFMFNYGHMHPSSEDIEERLVRIEAKLDQILRGESEWLPMKS